MTEPSEQAPTRGASGPVVEIVLWSLVIGAVLYTLVWRGDMPLRLVVTAHVVMTLIVAIPVVILSEKLFETLVLVVIMSVLVLVALPAYHEYSVRSSVREVVLVGDALAEALDRSTSRKTVDQLGVAVPQDKMAVKLEPDGSFSLTLAEPPLAGKQLSFVPTLTKGVRSWRCASRQIDRRYLPHRCREQNK